MLAPKLTLSFSLVCLIFGRSPKGVVIAVRFSSKISTGLFPAAYTTVLAATSSAEIASNKGLGIGTLAASSQAAGTKLPPAACIPFKQGT